MEQASPCVALSVPLDLPLPEVASTAKIQNAAPVEHGTFQVLDTPAEVVDAIFKHYETRGFAPSADEREMLLNL